MSYTDEEKAFLIKIGQIVDEPKAPNKPKENTNEKVEE